MTHPTNTPVDDVRIGRVKATIWRNETEDGKLRYNVVFARLYKDGDTWQSSQSFGRGDLLMLAKVADLAHTRVLQLPQESNGEDNSAVYSRFAAFVVTAVHRRGARRRYRGHIAPVPAAMSTH